MKTYRCQINLKNFSVGEISTSFDKCRGLGWSHNSQHYQLKGHALVEVVRDHGYNEIKLFHPDTGPDLGHFNIMVRIHGFGDEVSIETYLKNTIDISDKEFLNYWPNGAGHFLRVLLALEDFFFFKTGRPTGFEKWLVDSLSLKNSSYIVP